MNIQIDLRKASSPSNTIHTGNATRDPVDATTGTWSYTFPSLADDTYIVYVQDSTGSGWGASGSNNPLTFTVSAAPPVKPKSLAFSNDNGANGWDGVTSDNTLTFSGEALRNHTIKLYLDADGVASEQDLIASIGTDSNGNWSYDYTAHPLAEGKYTLKAIQVDTFGRESEPTSRQIEIVLSPPSAPSNIAVTPDTGLSSNDRVTTTNVPTFKGSAGPGSKVWVTVSGDYNVPLNNWTNADGNGNWSYQIWTGYANEPLRDGTHHVSVKATDQFGNDSPSSTHSFVVDTTAPTITKLALQGDSGASSTDFITNTDDLILEGSTEAGSQVKVSRGSTLLTTTSADENGRWVADLSGTAFAEGSHTLSIAVTDLAGNSGSTTQSVTVDRTAPAVTLNTPTFLNVPVEGEDGAREVTLSASGTGESAAKVLLRYNSLDLGSATVDGSTQWSVSGDLNSGQLQGAVTITAIASDTAGNTANADVQFTFPTANLFPMLKSLSDDNGSSDTDMITNDSTLIYSGTAVAGDAVTLLIDNQNIGTATTDSTSLQWTVDARAGTPLSEGEHSVLVRAARSGYNADYRQSLQIDTTPPPLSLSVTETTAVSAQGLKQHFFVLSGAGEAGTGVGLYQGTTLLETVTPDSEGKWNYTTSFNIDAASSYTFRAQSTDDAGNLAVVSKNHTATSATIAFNTPVITKLEADGDSAPKYLVSLSGRAAANEKVVIMRDGVEVSTVNADAAGYWSYQDTVAGDEVSSLSYAATTTSAEGFVVRSTRPLEFDPTTAFVPVLKSIDTDTGRADDDFITSDTKLVFFGTARPDSPLTLYMDGTEIAQVAVDGIGKWSYDYSSTTLSEGKHQFSFDYTNPSGFKAAGSQNLTIDTTAPSSATISSIEGDTGTAGDYITNDRTLAFAGSASAGDEIVLELDGREIGSVTTASDGTWKLDNGNSQLSSGLHRLTATIFDAAGNRADTARNFTIAESTEGSFALQFKGVNAQTTLFSDALNTRLADNAGIKGGNFTLMLWVFLGMDGSYTQRIVGNDVWRLQRNADSNTISFITTHTSGSKTVASSQSLETGVWTQVTVTCANQCADVELYFNGKADTSPTVTDSSSNSALTTSAANVQFGNDGSTTTTDSLNGLIDEFSLWGRMLTASEVEWYGSQQMHGDEDGLITYWNFNEYYAESTYQVTRSTPDQNDEMQVSSAGFVSGVDISSPRAVEKALYFDGIDDYVTLGNERIDSNADYSVELWAKRNNDDARKMVLFEQSEPNHVAKFDGVDDYIDVPDGHYFDLSFTVEAWVNPHSRQNWARVFDFGNGAASDNIILGLSDGASGRPFLSMYWYNTETKVILDEQLPLNEWTHLAVTYYREYAADKWNDLRFYVNGELKKTKSMPVRANFNRVNNYIAASNWAGDAKSNASIDEFRIWNYMRSQADIQASMYSILKGDEPGLSLYYNFESSGLIDDLAGERNGTVMGGSVTSIRKEDVWLGITPGKSVQMVMNEDGTFECALDSLKAATSDSVDSEWHHWGCIHSADTDNSISELELFQDGHLVASANGDYQYKHQSQTSVTLGKEPTGSYYKGWLDEVRIWTRALGEGEVVDLSGGRPESGEEGLVSNWTFNEVGGSSSIDSVESGDTATLYNMVTNEVRDNGVGALRDGITFSAGSAGGAGASGLWQGMVEVTKVNQLHAKANASDVTEPADTPTNFMLPILLHADANGQVQLLSEVTVMQKPVGSNESNQRVLVTDQTLLSNYEGVVRRNGKLVGLRFSAPAFVLEYDGSSVATQHAMVGGLGNGGVVNATIRYSQNHPLHPFYHRYHPDLGRDDQAKEIIRTIEISFDDPFESNPDVLEGRYREAVYGLHKGTVLSEGRVRLQRVSDVDRLNR